MLPSIYLCVGQLWSRIFFPLKERCKIPSSLQLKSSHIFQWKGIIVCWFPEKGFNIQACFCCHNLLKGQESIMVEWKKRFWWDATTMKSTSLWWWFLRLWWYCRLFLLWVREPHPHSFRLLSHWMWAT